MILLIVLMFGICGLLIGFILLVCRYVLVWLRLNVYIWMWILFVVGVIDGML